MIFFYIGRDLFFKITWLIVDKMKIISITTIKNEADIIESFVRYHSNIMDLMIILDNGSTDDTLDILNKLKQEGLPIVVINDEDRYFEPFIKYNYLLDVALNEYSADIICPLDCDEFIVCDDANPRKLIENISHDSYLKLKWRTYVPTSYDDENIKFIPSRITHVRDEKLETNYKVIITKELVDRFDVKLSIGNHDIDVEEELKDKIKCIDDVGLNIAHFPLRSINQTKSKVLLGYPNTLSRNTVVKGTSFHYEVMFNKIKNNEHLSTEDVTRLAKQYSLDFKKIPSKYEDDNLITIKEKPMDLSFCDVLEVKYHFNESPLNNLLENYIYFAKEINAFKNKLGRTERELDHLKDDSQKKIFELRKIREENKNQSGEINRLEDINEKLEVYGNKLKEDNLRLKDDNSNLKKDISQFNDKFDEMLERNMILTKTKTQLLGQIDELKETNSNQQDEINQLKNKNLKDYVKDLIR